MLRSTRKTSMLGLAILAALVGATNPLSLASAEEQPVLAPGTPIQPVFIVLPNAVHGEPALGCVGIVQLTLIGRGTSFPAVSAVESVNGCDTDLCAPYAYPGLFECREDEILGVYSTPVSGGGVDIEFTEVACLRNATLQINLDSDDDFEIYDPGFLTVTGGPC
jgi:hypothetical protein